MTVLYVATLHLPLPPEMRGTSFSRSRLPIKIASSHDLAELFSITERYLRNRSEFNLDRLALHAKWRTTESTPAQKKFIRSKLVRPLDSHMDALGNLLPPPNSSSPPDDSLDSHRLPAEAEMDTIPGLWLGRSLSSPLVQVDNLSKGQAMDVLTRIVHGGLNGVRQFMLQQQKDRMRVLSGAEKAMWKKKMKQKAMEKEKAMEKGEVVKSAAR